MEKQTKKGIRLGKWVISWPTLVLFLVIAVIVFAIFRFIKAMRKPTDSLTMLKLIQKQVPSKEFAKILTAQAMLETGKFTSRAYSQLNNAFGLGGESKLMSFRSVDASLKYLLQHLKDYGILLDYQSASDYAHALKLIRYYEANEQAYATQLKLHLFDINQQLSNANK